MEDSRARASSRTGTAEAKWRAINAEQRSSGLAVKAFCVTRGVSAASLFAWRRRLRPVEAEQSGSAAPVPFPAAIPVSFVEVVPPSSVADAVPGRQDVRMPIELELRDGRRVLVLRRGFDAGLLRDVLAVLEGGLPGRLS